MKYYSKKIWIILSSIFSAGAIIFIIVTATSTASKEVVGVLSIFRNIFIVIAIFCLLSLLVCFLIPIINKDKKEPEGTKAPIDPYKENTKKRFFIDFTNKWKGISGAALALIVIAFTLVIAIPVGTSGPKNSEPIVTFSEYDTGVNESHILEAESFTVTGSSGVYIYSDLSCSNCNYVSNLNVNGTLSVKFNSDKEFKIETVVRYKKVTSVMFKDMFDLTVNDDVIDLAKAYAPTDSTTFLSATLFIPIKVGTNQIVFTVKNTSAGLDYVDFRTSATINQYIE